MKRNHPIAAPRIRAEGEEMLAKQPPELGTPRPPGAGEITITQHVEITRPRPDRPPTSEERRASGAQRPARHTLVLIGELDRGSTHALEAEIERLCEAGIAGITLDLTKLSGIDSAGVAVLAFRSRWCRKRGHELVLIPGPPPVQRAFEQAGVARTLAFTDGEGDAEM
jgi:anti-anti-sigma factor